MQRSGIREWAAVISDTVFPYPGFHFIPSGLRILAAIRGRRDGVPGREKAVFGHRGHRERKIGDIWTVLPPAQ
jgi:hypothetical protein